ncbi:MAG: Gfo/Idh/MocA family oxidoreductase [Dehalococcoidia bacterium]
MTLRVGLIGCGFIGRFHSTSIRSIAARGLLDIQYTVVCDEDEKRAQSFAGVTGARATSEPLEVVASPDVDVVYVCVPTAGHKELVLRAAANGKAVFCEKPLAANLADVEEMVRAVEDAGVAAGVGLVLRHSPVFTVLKDLIDDASLGRMMAIVLRDDQYFPIAGHYASDWRKDASIAGAGTLLEHSIHDIDLLRWLGGDIESVSGATRNFAGYEGVEDLAFARLEFTSGAQASLASVWHSVLGRPSTRRLEVFMEKGVFWTDHDYMGPIHYQTHAQNAVTVTEEEVQDRYLKMTGLDGENLGAMMRYSFEDYLFLQAVIEGRRPYPDFGVALEAHRVVDAVYRSALTGGQPLAL